MKKKEAPISIVLEYEKYPRNTLEKWMYSLYIDSFIYIYIYFEFGQYIHI